MKKLCLLNPLQILTNDFHLEHLLLFDKVGTSYKFGHFVKILSIAYAGARELGKKRLDEVAEDFNRRLLPLLEHELLIVAETMTETRFEVTPKGKVPILHYKEDELSEDELLRATRLKFSKDYDVSVPFNTFDSTSYTQTKKEQVIQISLNQIPRLSKTLDIKRIIDFKNDPDTQLKLGALRNWINEMSYTNYSQNEIEDRFEFLLMQYKDHMDRAKLKYTFGSGEFLITAVPEIINDLIHLRLGSTAKALFSFAKKELILLEEERRAPGKELAFLFKA